MALPFFNWSRTAASNATADSTVNWAEGQGPSTVNDSARAMMASTAAYRDDIAGAITTGGTATAYTVTSFQVFDTLAHLSGQKIAFVPHATNTNAVGVDVTLNVDGLGAKSIRMAPSVALPNGTLVLGTPYIVTYNNSDSVFYLQNMTNPYVIPLGAGMDFWAGTAPNSSFAFAAGQLLSRTTYATLFNIFGTQYGAGDGSTTFAIPDKRGRVSAGVDNMGGSAASRLTSASGMGTGLLNQLGGGETTTLLTTHVPAHTHSGTTNNIDRSLSHTHTYTQQTAQFAMTAGGAGVFNSTTTSTTSGPTAPASDANLSHLHTFTTDNGTGSATPFSALQPTVCCNYILRII